jgi:hypothetical protein
MYIIDVKVPKGKRMNRFVMEMQAISYNDIVSANNACSLIKKVCPEYSVIIFKQMEFPDFGLPNT